MPTRKNQRPSSRLLRMGRGNLAVVAAFILVFAGFGAWFVYRSEAASCINLTLQRGSSGWCVSVLQDSMQVLSHHYGGEVVAWPGTVDGIYGYNTYQSVRTFQSAIIGQTNPSGAIIAIQSGGKTWPEVCFDLNYAHSIYVNGGSQYSYWRGRSYTDYQWLGCASVYGNFSK